MFDFWDYFLSYSSCSLRLFTGMLLWGFRVSLSCYHVSFLDILNNMCVIVLFCCSLVNGSLFFLFSVGIFMDLSSIFLSSPLQTSSNVTIRPTKWSKDGCIGLGADNREPREWWKILRFVVKWWSGAQVTMHSKICEVYKSAIATKSGSKC